MSTGGADGPSGPPRDGRGGGAHRLGRYLGHRYAVATDRTGPLMVLWIALLAGIAFLALTARSWIEFGQRARRLKAETDHTGQQIDDHAANLAMDRAKIDALKTETSALLVKRDGLERAVLEKRAELTQLEERLERTRPKSRRVDTRKEDGLF